MLGLKKINGLTAQNALLIVFLNCFLAIVAPLLLDYINDGLFEISEEIILGFLIVISLTMLEVFYYVFELYNFEKRQLQLWNQKKEIDIVLSDIRSSLHDLIGDQKLGSKFFIKHYEYELNLIRGWLHNTLSQKEIKIERNHIEATDTLLALYEESIHTQFRSTHLLWETGDKFDITYQFYFRAWLKKIENGEVNQIKRLFIYNADSDFQIPLAKKLMIFHAGFNKDVLIGKVISRKELSRFKSDFHITDGVEDFGVFSNQYLYLGSSRNAEQITGVFSKDTIKVNKYISMFDALWESPAAQPIEKFIGNNLPNLTEEQLFGN